MASYPRGAGSSPPPLRAALAEGVIVTATDLTRRLGTAWVLRGITVGFEEGRTTMVFGANGAGKTTLLRVLATALRPTTGTLTLFGTPASPDARPRIGLLSHQDGHYDELSGRENLAIARDLLGAGDVEGALGRVGLRDRGEDPVRTYSAGMRKRLAFARLLLKDPELVLLDEPYAQLDPEGHAFVDTLLGEFRARGRTVIVSTHQVERVAAIADHAVQLAGGRIHWTGPATDAPNLAGERTE